MKAMKLESKLFALLSVAMLIAAVATVFVGGF